MRTLLIALPENRTRHPRSASVHAARITRPFGISVSDLVNSSCPRRDDPRSRDSITRASSGSGQPASFHQRQYIVLLTHSVAGVALGINEITRDAEQH